MKHRSNTFRVRIISLFMLISLPAMGLSLVVSQINLQETQRQVRDARQNNMDLFVQQYDASLAVVENYVQTLLYKDNQYTALRLSKTQTRYQQARIWLYDELKDMLTYFPLISSFYVYVPGNEDSYMAKSPGKITLEAKEYLEETVPRMKAYLSPCVVFHGTEAYLVRSYRNFYVEVGLVIRLEELWEQFRISMETGEVLALRLMERDETVFLSGEEPSGMSGYDAIKGVFSVVPLELILYLPRISILDGMLSRDRMILNMALLLVALFPVFWALLRRWFLVPMGKISAAMQEILGGNIDYRIQKFSGTKEFDDIEQAFNHMLDYSQELKIEAYELKLKQEQEQLINLRLQINPHLLLNSLSVIHSLAVNQKTSQIQDFAFNLSKYFRYALRNSSEFVTVRSEIEFIKAYTQIQKIRYPDAFYVMYDVDEELMEEKIPPLIIQNFVENSTKYALVPGQEIEIFVIIRRQQDMLRISICDSGRGMEEEVVQTVLAGEIVVDSRGQHVGIWNCIKRLHSFYGNQVGFQISSRKGEGTQVWMELPCMEEGRKSTKEDKNEPVDCGG